MRAEEIKQDFEGALVKHFGFKAKLRSFLYGNGTDEGPLRNPDACALGQWITERRRGAYAHLPGMATLDEQHRRIHQLANLLMDLRAAGRTEEALAGFAAVQTCADEIVALLRTMEDQLRTES